MTRSQRPAAVVAAVLFGLQVAAMLLSPDAPGVTLVLDLVPIALPVVAAVGSFAAARNNGPARPFWMLLGVGALMWALGDAGFSVYELIDYDPAAVLSLADIGYLALIPAWGAALVMHPARSRRPADRVGTTVDGMVVFAFAATLTAVYAVIPSLREATDVGGAIVNVVYPVADLALIAILVATLSGAVHHLGAGDLLVVAAVTVFAAGDVAYAHLVQVGTYDVGNPIDLAWSGAFLLLALAAGRPLASSVDEERRAPFPILAFVGLGAIVFLSAMSLWSHLEETALRPADRVVSRPMLVGTVVTGILVVVRLAVLLFDRVSLIRALNENLARVKEAEAARERFIATVSHDLRSPLTSIVGFAQLIQDEDMITDRKQIDEMAASIERNGRHLTRLTEDLLCAGQFAAGHPPNMTVEPVDLRATTDELLTDLGRMDRVAVEGERGVYALADVQRIRQVLTNLVDNAIKHADASTITVRIGAEGDEAVLQVADDGKGIQPDKIDSIFEAFVSDFATASSIGLGLFVVRSLVEAMHGRLSVTSDVGKGTTFSIALPRTSADARAPREPAPNAS